MTEEEKRMDEDIVLINEEINPDKGYLVRRDGLMEFDWNKVEEKDEAGMVIVRDAVIYAGYYSYDFVQYRDVLSMVDDDYKSKVEKLVLEDKDMFTKLNRVDRFISKVLERLSFGHLYLTQPLLTPVRIYLEPGFYDFGFYTEWDEVAVPMEEWKEAKEESDEAGIEVERISMFHHTKNLEKKKVHLFDEQDGLQGEN